MPQSDLGDTEDVHSIHSDTDEEDADANLPGPSQISEVKWEKKGKVRTEIPNFSEFSGLSEEILDLEEHSPLSFFSISSILDEFIFNSIGKTFFCNDFRRIV